MLRKLFKIQNGRALRATCMCAAIGVMLSILLWVESTSEESKSLRGKIERDAQTHLTLIENEIIAEIDILRSTLGLFKSSQMVTREEFRAFTLPLLEQHRGLIGIDWAPRLDARDRESFISAMRQQGLPQYALHELTVGNTLTERSPSEVYFPVMFTEPFDRNYIALGFDHYSDPIRKFAMDNAVKNNQAFCTQPFRLFRLLEKTPEPADLLIVLPKIDEGRVEGFVIGVLRVSNIVHEAFKAIPQSGLVIDFEDVEPTGVARHMIRYPEMTEAVSGNRNRSERGISSVKYLDVAGRTWRFTFTAGQGYLEQISAWHSWVLLIAGLVITGLVAGYVFTLQSRNQRISLEVAEQTSQIRNLNEALERKVEERTSEAREAKQFVESLAENSTSIIYVYDLERTSNIYVNHGIEEFLGHDLDTIHRMKEFFLFAYVHPDDTGDVAAALDRLREAGDGDVVEFEIQVQNVVGEWSWYWNKARVFKRTGAGEVLQILGTAQDVTQRKQAEAALAHSEQEFKNAFQYAPIGMALVAPSGSWLKANPALCALVGYSEEELLRKTFQDITHPDDLALDLEYVGRMLRGEIDTYQLEKRYRHKSGTFVWILLSVSLVRNDDGSPGHFIAQMKDISARKEVEAALAEKNQLLERATEFKSQFLANMSHEIRTPLTSIIGYTDSLLSDELRDEEKTSALHTVLNNSKHLLGIISDILDFSKIEAGKLEVEILEISLFDIISDVGNLMQHRAMEQGLAFGFEYNFPLPATLHTDPTRLKQILINLIGNAVKFTKRGGVKVVVSCDVDVPTLHFAVTDTGIGLTSEQQNRLFQAFTQGDTSTTREFGGTGLGLVISHQLAAKLGGGIGVDSTYQRGSTFTLSIDPGAIPREVLVYSRPKQVQNVVGRSTQRQLRGKVLLAEDGVHNQKYISFVLTKSHIDHVIVENGALALEAMDKEPFDLVLMDMQMPIMDGYTAARMIRDRGQKLPIIALTANVTKQDIQRCLDAGCTDFMGKPFDRNNFIDKLAEFLHVPPLFADGAGEKDNEFDEAAYFSLVQKFRAKLPEHVNEMRRAFAAQDWQEIKVCAHRLRGAARMYGYPELSKIAGRLEDALLAGSTEAVDALMRTFLQVCADIEQDNASHDESIQS